MSEVLEAQAGAPAAPAPLPVEPAGKAPEPAKTPSIYEDVGVDEPGKPGPTTWPEDWRKNMAGGDDKAAKALERYQSPDAVAKALLAAQKKISSGEYSRGLSPDATPEEVAAWRAEQGIPAEPAGYDLLGGEDKYEALDEFGKQGVDTMRQAFHELGLKPEQASKIMAAATALTEKQEEYTAQQDAARQVAVEDELREVWGADYRRNIALNSKHLSAKFGDDWQGVILARMPDGTRLADSPAFNKAINEWARAEGGTILVGGEAILAPGAQARIAEIEKIMKSDFARYKREGLDVEYLQLQTATAGKG